MKVKNRKQALAAVGIDKEPTQKAWAMRGLIQGPPYTLPHLTGLALGSWMRKRDIGFRHVEKVIWSLSQMTEDQIESHFANGEHLLVLDLVSGKCWISREDASFFARGKSQLMIVDLRAAYERTTRAVSTLK